MVPKVVTPPAEEPISLEDCRMHLRLIAEGSPPSHEHDSMVMAQLAAAREWAEHFTGRTLARQTLEVVLDDFPGARQPIMLPRGPIATIVSVTYFDEWGARRTLAPEAYWLDRFRQPARLLPAAGAAWPVTTAAAVEPVVIRYEAGYGPRGESPQLTPPLPASIRAALLLVLGDLYEHAEDSADQRLEHIPRGAEALLRPYRVESGIA